MINKNKLNDLRKIIYRNSDILRNNKTRLSNFLQPYNKILYGGGNRVLSIKYDNNKYEFLEMPKNKIKDFIFDIITLSKKSLIFLIMKFMMIIILYYIQKMRKIVLLLLLTIT